MQIHALRIDVWTKGILRNFVIFLVRTKNNNHEITKNRKYLSTPTDSFRTRMESGTKFFYIFFFFLSSFSFFWRIWRARSNVSEGKFSRYDSSPRCKRGQWNTVEVENLRRGRADPVKTRRTITNHSGGCRWSGADYFQPFNSFHSVTFLSFPLCMRAMATCVSYFRIAFYALLRAKNSRLFAYHFFLRGY